MTIGPEPICMKCKHLIEDPEFDGYRCEAFPEEGIPFEIIAGFFDHMIPYAGDHGIQFELQEGKSLEEQP